MSNLNDLSNSVIFPIGEKALEAFAKYFTGTSHLAVEANMSAGLAEWLEPVTDDYYNKL